MPRLSPAITLALLVCAAAGLTGCKTLSGADSLSSVFVVGPSGAPLAGAVLLPDEEYTSGVEHGTSRAEERDLTSNAQGIISVDLDDYLWDADHCYHFRVRRPGYDDETVAVSKDLLTGSIKVDMKPRTPTQPGPTRPGGSN